MMRPKVNSGFTLIEALFSVALFIIVVMAVFAAYQALFRAMAVSEDKLYALELAQSKLEELRSLSFAQVVSTPPQAIERNGRSYALNLSVVTVDDIFDGVAPTDTDPIDYKHAYITVACANCRNFTPVELTGRYAP